MTTVGILGTIHDEALRVKYNCTLSLYNELIREFKPDIICGEVLPLSWQKYQTDKNDKGYWGEPASEYWDLIFPLCEELNIKFVPIDWVELDVWNNFDPFATFSQEEANALKAVQDEWFEKQMRTFTSGSIPFNSDEFDEVTRQKYEWLYQLNPQAQNIRWDVRNLIMVQRVRNEVKCSPGKRILCIVGADHNYFFKDELEKDTIQLIYRIR